MPVAVRVLRELGVFGPGADGSATASVALEGIRFLAGTRVAEARFYRSAQAFGVRRTALHEALHRRASALGVGFLPESARWDAGRVVLGTRECHPQWVIGADGAQSAVRAAAGLAAETIGSRRFGTRRHFRLTPWSRFVEVYWVRGAQAYVTPVAEDTVGVAVLSRRRFGSFGEALEHFPALVERFHGAEAVSRERGAVTVERTLRRVAEGRVLLVGDASGSVDAITGDGISMAAMQAIAAVEAIRKGSADGYNVAHRRLMRRARFMSKVLLGVGVHPLVSEITVGLLRGVPGLFPALLRFHTEL